MFWFLNVVHPKFDTKNHHSLKPLLIELPSLGAVLRGGCHGRCGAQWGRGEAFKMVVGKQEAKTRIFFLWQWGWVQIRSWGRGSERARGGFRKGGGERDPIRELWERLIRARLEERERVGERVRWSRGNCEGERGETDPVKLLWSKDTDSNLSQNTIKILSLKLLQLEYWHLKIDHERENWDEELLVRWERRFHHY